MQRYGEYTEKTLGGERGGKHWRLRKLGEGFRADDGDRAAREVVRGRGRRGGGSVPPAGRWRAPLQGEVLSPQPRAPRLPRASLTPFTW